MNALVAQIQAEHRIRNAGVESSNLSESIKRKREKANERQRKKRAAAKARARYKSIWKAARKAKEQYTSKWANREIVKALYAVAKAWRVAGIDVHVDHVLPLHGKYVSGLHNEHNLELVPARTNLKKSNCFIPR